MNPAIFSDPAVVAKVMAMYDNGALLDDVEIAVNVDGSTVTKIVREWHKGNGVPMIDGRTRRKNLERKTRKKDEQGPNQ